MEGSCKYTEQATADRGCPPAWGLGVGLTNPHHKKISILQTINMSLGLGLILWINDLSDGICI
jgi:hypothetical protein